MAVPSIPEFTHLMRNIPELTLTLDWDTDNTAKIWLKEMDYEFMDYRLSFDVDCSAERTISSGCMESPPEITNFKYDLEVHKIKAYGPEGRFDLSDEQYLKVYKRLMSRVSFA